MPAVAEDKVERPPFVQFERREVEDRTQTIVQGKYVGKLVDFALITPHGSRDSVEREVAVWFPYLDEQVRQGRVNPQWAAGWKHWYKQWQAGEEMPLTGTPIRTWTGVTPAQAKLLISLHLLTIEDLANVNDEGLGRIGMGANELKKRAMDFLKEAAGPGRLIAEVSALRVELADAKVRADSLEARNRELLARLDAVAPQPTSPPVVPPAPVASEKAELADIGISL